MMKPILRQYLLVTSVYAAPYLLVMAAGWWWLWQQGYLIAWGVAAALMMWIGWKLIDRLNRQNVARAPSHLQASPDWAPKSEPAWQTIEALSARARAEDWPLNDSARWQALLHEVLESVARQYHPESANPLLELPVTHIAFIIERVACDFREATAEKLPGSHILTVNDYLRLKGVAADSHGLYQYFYPVYRGLRLVLNPLTGLLREMSDQITGSMLGSAILDTRGFAIDFVVRRTGYYAIELYSGHMPIDESYVTRRSTADLARAGGQAAALNAEPLRILLIGQVNAGKSSAVNALFGDVKTAVDVLPTTREVTPYIFQRQGVGLALIFDTAGYGEAATSTSPFAALEDELLNCDLVLLVCSALTAARAPDRRVLAELAERWQREPQRRPPPVIALLTHVDMLRPRGEWNPPYNLAQPDCEKARQIAAVTSVVAEELDLPGERVIPACLLPEQMYNVEEGLVPALVEALPEGSRVKALRCLGAYRNEEYWRRLWRQTINAGNVLIRGASSVLRR
jgi:uncharacterized protein